MSDVDLDTFMGAIRKHIAKCWDGFGACTDRVWEQIEASPDTINPAALTSIYVSHEEVARHIVALGVCHSTMTQRRRQSAVDLRGSRGLSVVRL